ncbi:helix-turn-helix domain-containing protein [Enterococcus faecalis]|nr:helix-turn-helix domain-containing protein [Enterococcus faecalis]ELT8948120.1 helix-turn-helix domain-containing protein [Enterococcus faecalis]
MKYGKVIKILRQERNLTQKDLSVGICSRSTLSLIEQGNSKMYIDHLSSFLKRMNVSWYEFWFKVKLETPSQDLTLSEQIDIAKQGNISELFDLLQASYTTYKSSKTIESLRDLLWITSLFYEQNDQIDTHYIAKFSKTKIPYFLAHLNKNKNWGQYEFNTLINILNLLSSEYLINCYKNKLISLNINMDFQIYDKNITNFLVKSCFLTLKRHELHHFKFFLSELNITLYGSELYYEKTVYIFLKSLYNYLTEQDHSLEQAKSIINHFSLLEFNHTAEELKKILNIATSAGSINKTDATHNI